MALFGMTRPAIDPAAGNNSDLRSQFDRQIQRHEDALGQLRGKTGDTPDNQRYAQSIEQLRQLRAQAATDTKDGPVINDEERRALEGAARNADLAGVRAARAVRDTAEVQPGGDQTGDPNSRQGGTPTPRGLDLPTEQAYKDSGGKRYTAGGTLDDVRSGNLTLREGSKGQGVKDLQEILQQQGYDLGPKGADGYWGPKTEKAYSDFLRSRMGADYEKLDRYNLDQGMLARIEGFARPAKPANDGGSSGQPFQGIPRDGVITPQELEERQRRAPVTITV